MPEHLRLLNERTGELVKPRCRATNLCAYCQRQYVAETVEMLLLDAAEWPPNLWIVLTAREHLTRAECRRHLDHLRRVAKVAWPEVEWFVQVEFQRRGALHLNLLVKGVPDDQADGLLAELVRAWCRRVDAERWGQWIESIGSAKTVTKYLAKTLGHGLKAEQAPPIGWKGHRTSQTRGYLVRPASVMRKEARRSRRISALVDRGLTLEQAIDQVDELATWRIYRESPRPPAPVSVEARYVEPATPRFVVDLAGETREVAQPVARVDLSPAPACALPADAQTAAPDAGHARSTDAAGEVAPARARGRLSPRPACAAPESRCEDRGIRTDTS